MKVPKESYLQGKCATCKQTDSLDSMLRVDPSKGGEYHCKDCQIKATHRFGNSKIEVLAEDNRLLAPTAMSKAMRFMFG